MLNFSHINMLCIVLNLLILLALMKKFLYKPVLGVIAKRQELIDSQFARAKECEEEAKQLKAQYEENLSHAKTAQEQMLKEAKAKAGVEYEKILADAKKQAGQMLDDAKKEGLFVKEKSIKDAETEITRLAALAASKIVAQTSGEKSDYGIYEEFLKKAGEEA